MCRGAQGGWGSRLRWEHCSPISMGHPPRATHLSTQHPEALTGPKDANVHGPSRPPVSCFSSLSSLTLCEDAAEAVIIPTKRDIASLPLENGVPATPCPPGCDPRPGKPRLLPWLQPPRASNSCRKHLQHPWDLTLPAKIKFLKVCTFFFFSKALQVISFPKVALAG